MSKPSYDRRRDALGGYTTAVSESVAPSSVTNAYFTSTADYLIERFGLLLTTNEAAEILHCHPSHVRAMCSERVLPAIRINNRWRIHAAKLAAYLEGVV